MCTKLESSLWQGNRHPALGYLNRRQTARAKDTACSFLNLRGGELSRQSIRIIERKGKCCLSAQALLSFLNVSPLSHTDCQKVESVGHIYPSPSYQIATRSLPQPNSPSINDKIGGRHVVMRRFLCVCHVWFRGKIRFTFPLRMLLGTRIGAFSFLSRTLSLFYSKFIIATTVAPRVPIAAYVVLKMTIHYFLFCPKHRNVLLVRACSYQKLARWLSLELVKQKKKKTKKYAEKHTSNQGIPIPKMKKRCHLKPGNKK